MTATIRTAAEHLELATGAPFSVRLTRSMSRLDRHAILYRTAHREVTLTLRDGSKLTGVLAETPGYFAADQRLWLRVPGRKTRKPVAVDQVRHLRGFKAPSLAEAVTALIYVTASNPSTEQLAEAGATVRAMGSGR